MLGARQPQRVSSLAEGEALGYQIRIATIRNKLLNVQLLDGAENQLMMTFDKVLEICRLLERLRDDAHRSRAMKSVVQSKVRIGQQLAECACVSWTIDMMGVAFGGSGIIASVMIA